MTESVLEGKQLDDRRVAAARDALNADIQPIGDVRGSAEYRRRASANVLERLLRGLAGLE
jgi:xanthine dehydrogenase small subunit